VAAIMDQATPPDLLAAWMKMLFAAMYGCQQRHREEWVAAVLAAEPQLPQRLAALMGGGRNPTSQGAVSLLGVMFHYHHCEPRLQARIDSGFIAKLLPLLGDHRRSQPCPVLSV